MVGIIAVIAFNNVPRREAVQEAKSIAALPFIDMSLEKDQEYLCDWMTDELINHLCKIRDLRVPARTSAFMFKGTKGDIRDIGNCQDLRHWGLLHSGYGSQYALSWHFY